MQQMTHETLDTGLGSFRDSSPDYMLAPVGLASMQGQAQKLAEYGRNGDVYIVHAAQGETVIPLEVLNANPKVKGLLYKQMRDMGLDPKEFVVGDELNSINPVTGLPEFFFKKIFRAVKKVVKKVVNVAKKIAPIALPLIAATFGFPFLGTAFKAGSFASSALAGGLGTLAQGGSFKDALKSGLMAGGIASLPGGLKTLGTDKSFMSGVERSFTGAGAPSWQTQWGRLQEGELGDFLLAKPEGMDLPGVEIPKVEHDDVYYVPDLEKQAQAASASNIQPTSYTNVNNRPSDVVTYSDYAGDGFVREGPKDLNIIQAQVRNQPSTFREKYYQGLLRDKHKQHLLDELYRENLAGVKGVTEEALTSDIVGKRDWWDKASDLVSGKSYTAKNVLDAAKVEDLSYLSPAQQLAIEKEASAVAKSLSAGLPRKYGPSLAVAGAGAYAVGAFDAPDTKQPEARSEYKNPFNWRNLVQRTDESDADFSARQEEMRLRHELPDEALDPTLFAQGPYVIPPYSSQQRMFGADGGMAAYPRRELLVEGPGTERSDDIPAMLSDGEFVMNAKSVRGADPSGRGDRYAGARNLYDMMRNFEMKS